MSGGTVYYGFNRVLAPHLLPSSAPATPPHLSPPERTPPEIQKNPSMPGDTTREHPADTGTSQSYMKSHNKTPPPLFE